jgi:hypothetical protein
LPVHGVPLNPQDTSGLRKVGAEVLFWSQAQRDANFPHMEKIFPGHVVKAGGKVRALPAGKPLAVSDAELDAFIASQNVSGLIVLQDGKIRLERYARGYGREGRWTSFSVAKSFTSTLVGAAIKDGYIKSVDEPVTKYIPELAGSGYDGVTIAQLLTMTSGVKWNEDYTDAKSDVARMFLEPVPAGEDPTVYLHEEAAARDRAGQQMGLQDRRDQSDRRAGDARDEEAARRLSEREGLAALRDGAGRLLDGRSVGARGQRLLPVGEPARLCPDGQFALEGGKGVVPAGLVRRVDALACRYRRAGPRLWLSMVDLSAGPLRRAGDFRPDDPGRSEDAHGDRGLGRGGQGERPGLRHRRGRRSSTNCSRRRQPNNPSCPPGEGEGLAGRLARFTRAKRFPDPSRKRKGAISESSALFTPPARNARSRTPRPPAARIRSATTSGAFTVCGILARKRPRAHLRPRRAGIDDPDAHAADVAHFLAIAQQQILERRLRRAIGAPIGPRRAARRWR